MAASAGEDAGQGRENGILPADGAVVIPPSCDGTATGRDVMIQIVDTDDGSEPCRRRGGPRRG